MKDWQAAAEDGSQGLVSFALAETYALYLKALNLGVASPRVRALYLKALK